MADWTFQLIYLLLDYLIYILTHLLLGLFLFIILEINAATTSVYLPRRKFSLGPIKLREDLA